MLDFQTQWMKLNDAKCDNINSHRQFMWIKLNELKKHIFAGIGEYSDLDAFIFPEQIQNIQQIVWTKWR